VFGLQRSLLATATPLGAAAGALALGALAPGVVLLLSAAACAAAGAVTVELDRNGDPDGRATAVFRDAIAPLLRRSLGWGDAACTRATAE
jgi:hypothetical protein